MSPTDRRFITPETQTVRKRRPHVAVTSRSQWPCDGTALVHSHHEYKVLKQIKRHHQKNATCAPAELQKALLNTSSSRAHNKSVSTAGATLRPSSEHLPHHNNHKSGSEARSASTWNTLRWLNVPEGWRHLIRAAALRARSSHVTLDCFQLSLISVNF